MMLTEETPIPDAVLPVADLKAHLRLGSGFGQDDLQDGVLIAFLRAAVVAVEGRTDKVLIERRFSQRIGAWPQPGVYAFPVAPVADLPTLQAFDSLGTEVPVDPSTWRFEPDQQAPKIYGQSVDLPRIPRGGAIRVSFDAGYGAAWEDVPADLRQAVLMLAAHYYEYRHDTGLSDGCMPFGVASLLGRYRHLRTGAPR